MSSIDRSTACADPGFKSMLKQGCIVMADCMLLAEFGVRSTLQPRQHHLTQACSHSSKCLRFGAPQWPVSASTGEQHQPDRPHMNMASHLA